MSSRSWFYLTLWRGTPTEFTTEINAKIEEKIAVSSAIKMVDILRSEIKPFNNIVTNIHIGENIKTDITKSTEVIWYVG